MNQLFFGVKACYVMELPEKQNASLPVQHVKFLKLNLL